MSTNLMTSEPTAPAERSVRLLSIMADLLPTEVLDARRGRQVRKAVFSAVGTCVAFLILWYGQSLYTTVSTRSDLVAAQDDVQRLNRQQNTYADLVKTQSESKAIGVELPRLLADDLQWATLLSSLRTAAPSGVRLTNVIATLTTKDNPATTAKVPGAAAEPPMGRITISGIAPNKNSVAAYVDALAMVNGIGNPMLGDALDQEGGVHFTIRMDITKAALGGRYTDKSKDTSGK